MISVSTLRVSLINNGLGNFISPKPRFTTSVPSVVSSTETPQGSNERAGWVLAEVSHIDEATAGRGEIHARTAASIMYCADMCNRILDNGVQIHGGTGYIWESEMNRLFRSTKLLEIGAGTTEVRKMIIAGELLSD